MKKIFVIAAMVLAAGWASAQQGLIVEAKVIMPNGNTNAVWEIRLNQAQTARVIDAGITAQDLRRLIVTALLDEVERNEYNATVQEALRVYRERELEPLE